MALPRLLHPVPIVIEQISKATTFYDEDAREPIQAAARSSQETVQGQVKWEGDLALDVAAGGAQEGAQGYVLFRYTDLAAKGITLAQNDRIVKIGQQEVDVYVTKLRPVGHYPDQSGASLVKAFFMDRQPSRQRRGGYQ
jgi:hypothetical protein